MHCYEFLEKELLSSIERIYYWRYFGIYMNIIFIYKLHQLEMIYNGYLKRS